MSILSARPVVGTPQAWSFPQVDTQTLDGGLTLHQLHLPGKELVSVYVLLPQSTQHDPVGKEGLAYLSVCLLDEGTSQRSSESFSDALDLLGASWHASAGAEGIRVGVSAPKSSIGAAMGLLAEALSMAAITQREFERVRSQVINSIRGSQAQPEGRADTLHLQAIWDATSRYATPSAGTIATLEAITREDVQKFVAAFSPQRADLICTGDLTGLDMERVATKTFRSWKSLRHILEVQVGGLPSRNARLLIVDRPGSVQTQLALGCTTPSRTSPDWAGLQVGTYILGGNLSSRVNSVLREEKGYTYGMHAGLSVLPDMAGWCLEGSVDTPNTLAAVEELYGIMHTASEGVTAQEVAEASAYLVGVSPLRWETPAAVNAQVAGLLGAGIHPQWIDGYLQSMHLATVESVNTALQHVLGGTLSLVVVGDAALIAEGLAQTTGLVPEIFSE